MKVIRKVSMKNKDMGEERIFYKGWSYMAWVEIFEQMSQW